MPSKIIHLYLKLSEVNLEGTENLMPAELSGGMRKRVGIARATAIRPKYLFYDEPTTGLDPIMTDIINKLIVKFQKEYTKNSKKDYQYQNFYQEKNIL